MKQFDVAIIGLGSMGSFAALELAKRKLSVIGFDKYSPPHEEGSHGGDTRAFRTVYTEHPNYVPLIKRSLQIWDRLAEVDEKIARACPDSVFADLLGIQIPQLKE